MSKKQNKFQILKSLELDSHPTQRQLSNEVTTYFRALGKGWQTHMNEVLREYVSKHPV